jgi:hypothetical protein
VRSFSLGESRVRLAGECSVPDNVSAFSASRVQMEQRSRDVVPFVGVVGIDHGEVRGERPLGRSPPPGSRTLEASISTRPIHQINVEQIEATGDVSVDPVPGVRMVGLDNRIVLLDTVAMIRFPVAQQFWFFGYPTMLAAGGTRVI